MLSKTNELAAVIIAAGEVIGHIGARPERPLRKLAERNGLVG